MLIMAPIVYYLNKSYTSNYKKDSGSTIQKGKPVIVTATSRRDDSSKLFHWLWTTPGFILAASIVIGLGSSFYNVYYNELPPSWFYTMADPDSKALYFGEHMTKLWTHLAVFAMGILAGVECRRAVKNVNYSYRGSNINFMGQSNMFVNHQKSQSSSATSIPNFIVAQNGNSRGGNGSIDTTTSKLTTTSDSGSSVSININGNHNNNSMISDDGMTNSANGSDIGCVQSCQENNINNYKTNGGFCSILLDILGFIMAITIMSAIIFSTHDWSLNNLPRPLIAGIFDAGSRFLWSMAMIFILFKISVPNQDKSFSFLARCLGHPAMICLGKLSFLIYIIHPFVHTAVLAIQEQPIYSSWLMMFHILIGNITITVILASLVSLFVEMPCRNLFRRCGTSLLLTQSIQSGGGGGASSTGPTARGAGIVS